MQDPAWAKLGDEMRIEDRVEIVAPKINSLIESFTAGSMKDGVETFQEHLIKILEYAMLADMRWISVDKAGVHPDNREGTGLVPIDVHDLLLLIALAGWSWLQCNSALACEIPPNEIGEAWRANCKTLAEKSDGLLAPYNPGLLEVLTARGSHTTAAVRCYMYGTRGIHEQVCLDGVVSKSKIIERQPSMQEPLDKGIHYRVLRWQIAVACPRLMEVLSRTGNASHGVHRAMTALQGCKRMHMLAVGLQNSLGKEDIWDEACRVACIGMPPTYADTAKALCAFVSQWSGGGNGHVLKNLEEYERVLDIKRMIAPADLKSMGEIVLPEAPRYVPAMVKALLVAPACFVSNGVATIFTSADFHSLHPGGKHRQDAIDANKIMQAAHIFIDAYARIHETEKLKVLSELEVNCVMFTHGKKSATRTTAISLLGIAKNMYDTVAKAMQLQQHRLPAWPLLAALETTAPKAASIASGSLREFGVSGDIATAEMDKAGFCVGATVMRKGKSDPREYTIWEAVEQMLVIGQPDPKKPKNNIFEKVHRSEMLSNWMLKAEIATEASTSPLKQMAPHIYIYICIYIYNYIFYILYKHFRTTMHPRRFHFIFRLTHTTL